MRPEGPWQRWWAFQYTIVPWARTSLTGHSGPPTPTVRKEQRKNKGNRTEKRETRKAKTHPVPQHATQLAQGPFLLPHGLPGAYSRVTSTPIFAHPAAWAGSVSAGRSSPLSSWWWRLPPSSGSMAAPCNPHSRSLMGSVTLLLNGPLAIPSYPLGVGACASVF